ncbi:MAG: ATP-dependent endonuclease [Cytophagales bacterium]|nr:ATP-dependent endonuclease [Cytophagales bacterium]
MSKLIISNYRSIKELSVSFEKGKNIIVGKNNAGKSNIIKAIDLILGESSPTWHKSENITANDFFNGQTENDIYIFCELQRDFEEELNYEEINKCYGFKIFAEKGNYVRIEGGKGFYNGIPIRVPISTKSIESCRIDLQAVMDISEEDADGKTIYINPKLQNQATFEGQFQDKYHFAYGFRAFENSQGKFSKEIRFFYRESEDVNWVMAFSASVRNELLQSAIIHSFRDPANELRINQWSWFGKLLKEYIKADDPDLLSAFDMLKTASNGVFKDLQEEINNSKVKIAFPDTSISFQFNPDTKIDIYKSALIYVNDGFNSLLQDKGSGIQSAVIIGLYNYYTNNIAHSSSSLLAVEEPEIYLHPQARRVISNRIDDFLQGNKNQVIITTHSTEFITSAHENLNIISVRKEPQVGSKATNTKFDTSKEKQLLVKTQNSEMFFADKVILVEGGDKYIVEALAHYLGKHLNPDLGENWLDEQNISVIAVGGKGEFSKYVNKLNDLKIPVFVLADFDFFLRGLPRFFSDLSYPQGTLDELNALKGKLHLDTYVLSKEILNQIKTFTSSFKETGLKVDESEIKRAFKEKVTAKRISHFAEDKQTLIKSYLKRLEKIDLFILENELENYFTEECKLLCKGINGKEEKPIFIVSQLLSDDLLIDKLIDTTEYLNFLNHVSSK